MFTRGALRPDSHDQMVVGKWGLGKRNDRLQHRFQRGHRIVCYWLSMFMNDSQAYWSREREKNFVLDDTLFLIPTVESGGVVDWLLSEVIWPAKQIQECLPIGDAAGGREAMKDGETVFKAANLFEVGAAG